MKTILLAFIFIVFIKYAFYSDATDTNIESAQSAYEYDKWLEESNKDTVFEIKLKQEIRSSVDSYKCDGRKYCSQMTSCDEATFFINNCPNTKMDGNNDGVPCEKQWCN